MFKFNPFQFIVKIVIISCICLSNQVCAQSADENKFNSGFYFSWGYNKDYFSKSDIHFKDSGTDSYDFVLKDAKAVDRPQFNKILKTDISIPQYVYRLGYYFKSKPNMGIEINFDHAKYVVYDDQTLHIKGEIRGRAVDMDTLIINNFIHFEHTNGANFLMLNYLYRINLYSPQNQKTELSLVFKSGMGTVIPKTDVTFMGTRLDNKFHIAGIVAGEEIAIRYRFYKGFNAEFSSKNVYANYFNALGVGTAKVNHHFFATMLILTLGYQF